EAPTDWLEVLPVPGFTSTASADRSSGTPLGSKPTGSTPASGSPGLVGGFAGSMIGFNRPAFAFTSTSTSLASPQDSPARASILPRASEYPGYCEYAPLASDSTSNSTIAAATRVSGMAANFRTRRPRTVRVDFGGLAYPSRSTCQPTSSNDSPNSTSITVLDEIPNSEIRLSNHGTP